MTVLGRGRALSRIGVIALSAVLLLGSVPSVMAQSGPAYVLRVLHTNDHHARIEPALINNKPFGGVARRKTLIDQIRAEGGNQLLLDAGDVFQGTLYFNQYSGQADLWFYNALKYDAMTVGNHEFDRGQQPLLDFINGASFPIISANIAAEASSPLAGKIKPWIVKEVNGEKIGIFGMTTEETAILSTPGPGVTFTPVVDAARKSVADLQAQGVNKIIALTHIGYEVDQALATQVAGIDLIVGGHSHTPLDGQPGAVGAYPAVSKGPDGNNVVIVTDWEWGKYLGDISVGFDASGNVTNWQGAPHAVDETITPDPTFEAKVAEYAAPIAALRASVIGEAAVALNGARADVRTKETNLGNLIADAMLAKSRQQGAQVALMNGGGIRAGIDAGPITQGEVLEVQPFGNTLALVTLTGAQLKAALENGVSQAETQQGRFPQVAGMRFTWNPAAAPGSRVVSIEIANGSGGYAAVDPAASYRVATINFMLTGGDGYAVLAQGTNKIDTGFIDADTTTEYIRANSPVNPQVEGRITQGTAAGAPAPAPSAAPSPAPSAAPSTAPAPSTPAGGVPVSLPNTGGDDLPVELLALLAAASVGGGVALRRRRAR